MLQFQFQTVNAVQVSSQIEINVSGLLVPCRVVRDSIHPAFRVRLQFILERVQNPESSSDFFVRCITHVRSSPKFG